uniref:SXP/RAL-2 family protein Ani s 5-like cation-binding domain-containing protein n=1 Tax=Strongyloides stercoralis TaxID=6248 RepID=A0A0K0E194_STRER
MYFKNILCIFFLLSYFSTVVSTEEANEIVENNKGEGNEEAEMAKTINAINSVPLEEKFNDSKDKLIEILKTNDTPTDKIKHINQMMNETKFTEDEQIQFYKTLTDAVLSSKN